MAGGSGGSASNAQIGDIIYSSREFIGDDWLECDGSICNHILYPNLYDVLPPINRELASSWNSSKDESGGGLGYVVKDDIMYKVTSNEGSLYIQSSEIVGTWSWSEPHYICDILASGTFQDFVMLGATFVILCAAPGIAQIIFSETPDDDWSHTTLSVTTYNYSIGVDNAMRIAYSEQKNVYVIASRSGNIEYKFYATDGSSDIRGSFSGTTITASGQNVVPGQIRQIACHDNIVCITTQKQESFLYRINNKAITQFTTFASRADPPILFKGQEGLVTVSTQNTTTYNTSGNGNYVAITNSGATNTKSISRDKGIATPSAVWLDETDNMYYMVMGSMFLQTDDFTSIVISGISLHSDIINAIDYRSRFWQLSEGRALLVNNDYRYWLMITKRLPIIEVDNGKAFIKAK